MLLRHVVPSLIASLLCSGPAVAEPLAVHAPGTQVSLVPPRGFQPATRFSGFENAEAAASIMISELPTAAAGLQQQMSGEKALATRGMRLVEARDVDARGGRARLLDVRQDANGVHYAKWMLIGGDARSTALVVATFPADDAELSKSLRAAVLSASWSDARESDPFAGSGFRLGDSAVLKYAHRLGSLLLWTESGWLGRVPQETMLGAGISAESRGGADLRTFARTLPRLLRPLRDVSNLQSRTTTLGGLPAEEVVADARDVQTGAAVRFYAVVGADRADFYLFLVGLAPPDRFPALLPEYRRLAGTFERDAAER
jgi:hypothetical protein